MEENFWGFSFVLRDASTPTQDPSRQTETARGPWLRQCAQRIDKKNPPSYFASLAILRFIPLLFSLARGGPPRPFMHLHVQIC
jgi:hypothetical protein